MTKKLRYILAFLVLALIVAFFVWRYTFKASESSVASRKTDISIEAPLLLREYESNEDSANLRFLDKVVMVSGTVNSISSDTAGYTVYLRDSNSASGVMCIFDNSAFEADIAKVGFPVSIKGICTGYLMDVILNKCSFEDKSKP